MTSVARYSLPHLTASHLRKWLFCLCVAFLLAACGVVETPLKLAGQTMGTTWHVTLIAPAGFFVDDIEPKIEDILDRVNADMSTYQSDSLIVRFNRQAPDVWFPVTHDFLQVLETALDIGERSGYAYDVTVAPLVDIWGFGAADAAIMPPSKDAIESALDRVGQDRLQLDTEHGRIMQREAVSLDFSSLAKGFAVDRIAEMLQQQGIDRFMVEVGGEMRLSGLSARGDLWRIAIERPDTGPRSLAQPISLTDVAIATSGDYRNFFQLDGQRYSHMIDPRTGWPVAHDLVSVTVVHPSCTVADAWATALAVIGADRAMALAQEQALAVYFIRRVGDKLIHNHTPLFSVYLEDNDNTGKQAGI